VKHPEISRANDGGEENGRQGSVHDAFSQQLSTRPETLSKVPETIEQIVESGSTSSGRGEETEM